MAETIIQPNNKLTPPNRKSGLSAKADDMRKRGIITEKQYGKAVGMGAASPALPKPKAVAAAPVKAAPVADTPAEEAAEVVVPVKGKGKFGAAA